MKPLLKLLPLMLIYSSIHADGIMNQEVFFSCNTKNEKIILYGIQEKNSKKIRIETDIESIDNMSKWLPLNQINGKLYSESFSRGAQSVIVLKINGSQYIFEDSIVAKGINEKPSHNIIKTVNIIKSDKNKIQLNCVKSDDGIKASAYRFFEQGDMYSEYENNAVDINTKSVLVLKLKSLLYKEPSESSKSKMYLIAGDKVTLLDTKVDNFGQEWYYISYQGKKEIKAWIKAEAVK